MRPPHRAHRLQPLSLRLVLSTALTLVLSLQFSTATALTPDRTGRWTGIADWDRIAVHMALLPGHGGDHHSRILLWYGLGRHERLYGRLWGWDPGEYGCSSDSFPGFAFTTRPFPMPIAGGDTAQVFCSSNTHLGDGRLFLAGGTQAGTENGIRDAWIFDPATESWARQDSMRGYRWYPTGTLTADGRVVVVSGSRYKQLECWGGVRDGETAPLDSALWRWALWGSGLPRGRTTNFTTFNNNGLKPRPRRDHAAVWHPGSSTVMMFGGRDGTQAFNNTFHFRIADTPETTDEWYEWHDLSPAPPPPRYDLTIVPKDSTSIAVIYGGVIKQSGSPEVVTSEVRRFNLADGTNPWPLVTVLPSADQPGPRRGHVAVMDDARRRMIVFGGRSGFTDAAADGFLWVFQFTEPDLSEGQWQKIVPSGPSPSPRYDHALGFDRDGWPTTAFIFGGELGGGARANDLWRLDLATLAWTRETLPDSVDAPSPRSDATLVVNGAHRELLVFGGVSPVGAMDDTVYAAHVEPMSLGQHHGWMRQSRMGASLRGHTAFLRPSVSFERAPEVAYPAGNEIVWDSAESGPRLQEWYPQGFALDHKRVFYAGPSRDTTWIFDADARTWTRFPDSAPSFVGGSAVMYRPGQVMKGGTRDTEAGQAAHGKTAWIDLTQGAGAVWDTAVTADRMIPRVNHNLVLLPTGQVLVTGGTSVAKNDALIGPVLQPEVWTPPTGSSPGKWSGAGVLAQDVVPRDYHATALLLPDGRVLSAGGNADTVKREWVNIYCPPYLFNADGSLRVRPTIDHAPHRLRYGRPLRICIPSLNDVGSVCLIRAGATTHGFDEDQRFVPLTVEWAQSQGTSLALQAVPDSTVAPPGDYLLFVVKPDSTPSIARWVRVGSMGPTLDTLAPGSPALQAELVQSAAIYLAWPSPGDDGLTEGMADAFDVRVSTDSATAAGFTAATDVTGEPAPACPGTTRGMWVTGLQPMTWYWLAMRTRDASGNLSAVSLVRVRTIGSGGGSGTDPRQEGDFVAGGDALASTGVRRDEAGVAPAALLPGEAATTLTLAVETGAGGTRLRLTRSAVEGGTNGTTGVAIAEDGIGAPRIAEAPATEVVGVRTLTRAGTVRGLDPSALAGIVTRSAQAVLVDAVHARLGDLTATAQGAPLFQPELLAGDTLWLEYAPAPLDTGATDCLVLMRFAPPPAAPASQRPRSRPETGPVAFALEAGRPNPFGLATAIRFALPRAGRTRLEVYDLQGRRVRVLIDGERPAGAHEATWDGRDEAGHRVSPGSYLYRLEAVGRRATRKLVVLP